MSTVVTYELFLDVLAQLQDDQSLFESEAGSNETLNVQIDELVKLGGDMLKQMLRFGKLGQSFAEGCDRPTLLSALTETMHEYHVILLPPKRFGGFCPCLKPIRSGVKYEKDTMNVRSKVIAAAFLCQAVMIENKGEKSNLESMKFTLYTNQLTEIVEAVWKISFKGNEKAREKSKLEIQSAADSVKQFLRSNFMGSGDEAFKSEALRRLKSCNELLTCRSNPNLAATAGIASASANASAAPASDGLPISRKILIKALSSLQEILNSASAISLMAAKKGLHTLEDLDKELQQARSTEVEAFNAIEEQMTRFELFDALHMLRTESELVHSEAASKLKDASKRWTALKQLSVPRAVAEEEWEAALLAQQAAIAAADPQKMISNTGKSIENMGKTVVTGAKGVVTGAKDTFGSVAGDVVNFATFGVNGAANMATSGANTVMNVGNKVVSLPGKILGLDDSGPAPPRTPVTKSNNPSAHAQSSFISPAPKNIVKKK